MIFRCYDTFGNERKMLNVTGEIEIKGGLGAGLNIQTYPSPHGGDRNMKGDLGKKLKHLAGKPLPWARQTSGTGFGGLEFNSTPNGETCTCPPEGWEGSLKLGVYGELGTILTGEAKGFLEWKMGTPFNLKNIDGKLEASLGLKPGATAQFGVFGSTEATWRTFIE
jgi:hypothetical protein